MPQNSAPATRPSAAPRVTVRHIQLIRAIVAAIAALMITFSPDHSAVYGLATFSGFAIATALVLAFGAWMAYPRGRRWPVATAAVLTAIAGMVGGVPQWRSTALFFAIIITWAAVTGLTEIAGAWVDRVRLRDEAGDDPQRRSEIRDALTVGIITVVLAIAVGLVSPDFRLDYFIDDAGQWFALTGITIAVGLFGGYAAIVAVYLGIAAFTPRREAPEPEDAEPEDAADSEASTSVPSAPDEESA
ncbi:MAG TPA: acyl-CoA synthetase [Microbacterium sp.]|nr:acyl-CoA synthetase [Microbacterium sp.]